MSNEILYGSNLKEYGEINYKTIEKKKTKLHKLCDSSGVLINFFEEYKHGFKTDKELIKECKDYISLLNTTKKKYLKV